MRIFLVGLSLVLASILTYAQSDSSCENLIRHLAHEPHVIGINVGVCDKDGNLANAWTHPRVRCLVVDTDETQTYMRVKSEFPVGSKFESVFVYVTYIDSEAIPE